MITINESGEPNQGQDSQSVPSSTPLFSPGGYPPERLAAKAAEPPTVTTAGGYDIFRWVDQHVEYINKLMEAQLERQKVEFEGKIDSLRREVDGLQTTRQQKNQKRWETRVLVLSIMGTVIITKLVDTYWPVLWDWLTRP